MSINEKYIYDNLKNKCEKNSKNSKNFFLSLIEEIIKNEQINTFEVANIFENIRLNEERENYNYFISLSGYVERVYPESDVIIGFKSKKDAIKAFKELIKCNNNDKALNEILKDLNNENFEHYVFFEDSFDYETIYKCDVNEKITLETKYFRCEK